MLACAYPCPRSILTTCSQVIFCRNKRGIRRGTPLPPSPQTRKREHRRHRHPSGSSKPPVTIVSQTLLPPPPTANSPHRSPQISASASLSSPPPCPQEFTASMSCSSPDVLASGLLQPRRRILHCGSLRSPRYRVGWVVGGGGGGFGRQFSWL